MLDSDVCEVCKRSDISPNMTSNYMFDQLLNLSVGPSKYRFKIKEQKWARILEVDRGSKPVSSLCKVVSTIFGLFIRFFILAFNIHRFLA